MIFIATLRTQVSEHICAIREIGIEIISPDIHHAMAKASGLITTTFPHHYIDEIVTYDPNSDPKSPLFIP